MKKRPGGLKEPLRDNSRNIHASVTQRSEKLEFGGFAELTIDN